MSELTTVILDKGTTLEHFESVEKSKKNLEISSPLHGQGRVKDISVLFKDEWTRHMNSEVPFHKFMGELQKKTLGYHEIINTIQKFEDVLETPICT